MSRRSSRTEPGGERATRGEPLVARLAICLALGLGWLSIVPPSAISTLQGILFCLASLVGLLPSRWGWAVRGGRWLLVILTVPWFLRGPEFPLDQEFSPLAYIQSALMVCVYLSTLSRLRTERDLGGFALLVLCLFFFSAAFLHSDFYVIALLGAMGLLLLAYYAGQAEAIAWVWRYRGLLTVLTLSHLSLVLLVVVALFFSFPRRLFSNQVGPLQFLVRHSMRTSSSYSQPLTELGIDPRHELLQLTNLHELARTSAEVLQIQLVDVATRRLYTPERSMYLRASLYDRYRNGSWTTGRKPVELSDSGDGRMDGWVQVTARQPQSDRQILQQHIRLKPLGDLCFCLPNPLAVRLAKVRVLDHAVLMFPTTNFMDREYYVVSELVPAQDSPALIASPAVTPSAEFDDYLHVPGHLVGRLRTLERRFLAADTEGPWDRAEKIRRFLESHYAYSLGAFAPPEKTDPIEYFLFQKKEGYCTHFASAMALLARLSGLPARVATGFHFAGPPETNGFYTIRDHHAHAWTEVFFPNQGWVTFDATPTHRRPPLLDPAEAKGIGYALLGLIQLNGLFSEFDSISQKELIAGILAIPVVAARFWGQVLLRPPAWILVAVLALLSWWVCRHMSPRRRRWWRQQWHGWSGASPVPFYNDFLWILARIGRQKPDAMTGREFARTLVGLDRTEDVHWFTDRYYAIRYGGEPLSPELQEEAERRLQSLESALSQSTNPSGKSLRRTVGNGGT